MSGPLNQFSVYRLRRDMKETRTRRHQSYAYLQQYGLQVRSDYYDQLYLSELYLSEFDPETTEMELRRRLEKDLPADASGDTLAIGDVLAITREGITEAFYVDKQFLVPLKGFFHVASSSGLLTMDTKDYQIEGRAGNWFAAEETWIDGRHFLLMQSQKHSCLCRARNTELTQPTRSWTAAGISQPKIPIRDSRLRQSARSGNT